MTLLYSVYGYRGCIIKNLYISNIIYFIVGFKKNVTKVSVVESLTIKKSGKLVQTKRMFHPLFENQLISLECGRGEAILGLWWPAAAIWTT